MTDKRAAKQAEKTIRQEIGRKHAKRVGNKAISSAAAEVAGDPTRLNEVVQRLKAQPAPRLGIGRALGFGLVALFFGVCGVAMMSDPSSESASTVAYVGTKDPTKRTVSQELAEKRWINADEKTYRAYCRSNGRCDVSGYVLDTALVDGATYVTRGDPVSEPPLRLELRLRNAKSLNLYGHNYLAAIFCAPPAKNSKTLSFRNCRHDRKTRLGTWRLRLVSRSSEWQAEPSSRSRSMDTRARI